MNTILVIGSSLEDKGGISTVMNNIEKSSLNKKYNFIHVTTYETTNILKKMIIYIIGIAKILFNIKKTEIAHIHMSYKGSFYRKSVIVLLLKLFKKSIIIHVHGSCFKEFYNDLGKITKFYCRFILNKSDKVIVLSQSWKDFFSALVEENKIEVLNNNVRISNEKYNKNKKIKKVEFLFLGRLGRRKGVYDLIEVVKKLKQKYSDKFKLVIAGDGEIEKVNEIIEKENLTGTIENLGWITGKQKEEMLKKSNVFILPSYNEGLPMSILEAMSYHMPCISTEVGGIPEVLENKVNGYLIKPGDKEELYSSMERMINDTDQINIMGEKAFETVKNNFNEEKEMNKLDEIYSNLTPKTDKIKNINFKSVIIHLIIGLLLFQDTIQKIIGFNGITYIDEIFIVTLSIVSVVNIIKYKRINKFSIGIFIGTLIFSIVGIISCYINSSFNIIRTILSNFLATKFIVLILAIINININEKVKDEIISAIIFWAKIVLIGAIFNIVFQETYAMLDIGSVTYRSNMIAVCSLFNHPGKYGWFMLFIAIYYFAKYKETRKINDLIWTIIYVLFSLLSLRTKVIVSIVAIIGYELFIRIKNKQIKLKTVLIIFIIMISFLFIFKDILLNTYTLYFTTQNGTSARMALNENAIKISKEYFPLGVGFGKFGSWHARLYYSEYYYEYGMDTIYGLEPTNAKFGTDVFWPAIIGETGVLGLIVYVYIFYSIYKFLRKTINQEDNNCKLKILSNFAILAFIQTLCESVGEPSFNSAPQNIFLAIIIGITLCRRER